MFCCKTGSAMSAAMLLASGAVLGVIVNESATPSSAAVASQPEGEMSYDEMMEAWAQLGTPGEYHKKLDYSVGDWNVSTTFAMPGPDGEMAEMTSTGSMKSEWVLGGRFVQTHYHLNDMMGQPFDGIAYVGYDNGAEQYVSIWMDSMSTKAYVHKGWFEGDTFITQGENSTGGEMRIVSKQIDDDTVLDEFYERMSPDQDWTMNGSSKYTRK